MESYNWKAKPILCVHRHHAPTFGDCISDGLLMSSDFRLCGFEAGSQFGQRGGVIVNDLPPCLRNLLAGFGRQQHDFPVGLARW